MDVRETPTPFMVQRSPIVGRCLVASKDLSQGELIIRECPIVHGPSRDSDPVCLGCYRFLTSLDDDELLCSFGCSIALCDSCNASTILEGPVEQHLPECQSFRALQSEKLHKLLINPPLLYEVILVLRCLWLKQMNTELFSELMLFESHLAERDEDPEVEERVRAVANVVVNELRIDGVSMQDVRLICGILDVNSFEITTAQGESSSIQAVYRSSSLAEHRCVPNLHRTFEISTLEICLRAMQPITAGTHLTITYTDSLWYERNRTTRDRRLHLKFSKYFDCSCRRCSDPTELGTFLSSIKCPKCPIGFIQSDDPLEDDSHWTCESCIASFPPSFPERVNEEVSTTVNIMERAGAGVEQCERILHPQHALMIDVSHTLLHTLGHSDGYLMNTLSDRQLQTREDIARRLLRIASKLLPGMSRLKGTTLYELFLTHQQRALRWEQSGTRSWRDILASFAAGRDCLELCLSCLKFESEQSAEGNLATTASQDLKLLLEYMSRVKQLNTSLPRNEN